MRTVHLSTSERAAYGADRFRTESGREVRSGDIVTPDDPIVLPASDGAGATIEIGFVSPLPADEEVRCQPLMGPIVDVLGSAEAERLATWDRVLP